MDHPASYTVRLDDWEAVAIAHALSTLLGLDCDDVNAPVESEVKHYEALLERFDTMTNRRI